MSTVRQSPEREEWITGRSLRRLRRLRCPAKKRTTWVTLQSLPAFVGTVLMSCHAMQLVDLADGRRIRMESIGSNNIGTINNNGKTPHAVLATTDLDQLDLITADLAVEIQSNFAPSGELRKLLRQVQDGHVNLSTLLATYGSSDDRVVEKLLKGAKASKSKQVLLTKELSDMTHTSWKYHGLWHLEAENMENNLEDKSQKTDFEQKSTKKNSPSGISGTFAFLAANSWSTVQDNSKKAKKDPAKWHKKLRNLYQRENRLSTRHDGEYGEYMKHAHVCLFKGVTHKGVTHGTRRKIETGKSNCFQDETSRPALRAVSRNYTKQSDVQTSKPYEYSPDAFHWNRALDADEEAEFQELLQQENFIDASSADYARFFASAIEFVDGFVFGLGNDGNPNQGSGTTKSTTAIPHASLDFRWHVHEMSPYLRALVSVGFVRADTKIGNRSYQAGDIVFVDSQSRKPIVTELRAQSMQRKTVKVENSVIQEEEKKTSSDVKQEVDSVEKEEQEEQEENEDEVTQVVEKENDGLTPEQPKTNKNRKRRQKKKGKQLGQNKLEELEEEEKKTDKYIDDVVVQNVQETELWDKAEAARRQEREKQEAQVLVDEISAHMENIVQIQLPMEAFTETFSNHADDLERVLDANDMEWESEASLWKRAVAEGQMDAGNKLQIKLVWLQKMKLAREMLRTVRKEISNLQDEHFAPSMAILLKLHAHGRLYKSEGKIDFKALLRDFVAWEVRKEFFRIFVEGNKPQQALQTAWSQLADLVLDKQPAGLWWCFESAHQNLTYEGNTRLHVIGGPGSPGSENGPTKTETFTIQQTIGTRVAFKKTLDLCQTAAVNRGLMQLEHEKVHKRLQSNAKSLLRYHDTWERRMEKFTHPLDGIFSATRMRELKAAGSQEDVKDKDVSKLSIAEQNVKLGSLQSVQAKLGALSIDNGNIDSSIDNNTLAVQGPGEANTTILSTKSVDNVSSDGVKGNVGNSLVAKNTPNSGPKSPKTLQNISQQFSKFKLALRLYYENREQNLARKTTLKKKQNHRNQIQGKPIQGNRRK